MDLDLARTLVSRLNNHAYGAFLRALFGYADRAGECVVQVPHVAEGAFYQEILDSYGGSLHSVFLPYHFPLSLLRQPATADLADPLLISRLRAVAQYYRSRRGAWGMVSPSIVEARQLQTFGILTNLAGLSREEYDHTIIPKLWVLARKCGIRGRFLVGSVDSFFDQNPGDAVRAAQEFLTSQRDGISICLDPDHCTVRRFVQERNLDAGVLQGSRSPCEPVYALSTPTSDGILEELGALLRGDPSEGELEEFLRAHYQEVFGFEYDRVETQLWLRFPELDVDGRKRRLDVFLRNSIEHDWHLFEVKKIIPLVSSYRDVPVLSHQITGAIQQVRNYGALLAQDSVRRRLAREGIEYYCPTLHLVVGKTPQIPLRQWRWLKTSNEQGLKIITYDSLLQEMRLRLGQRRLDYSASRT